MKIFKKFLLLTLALMLSAFCFSAIACTPTPTDVTGKTYVFSEMEMHGGGMDISIKAGDNFMGTVLDKDYMSFTFNADGTVVAIVEGESMDGTWSQNGKTVTITIQDEPQDFTATGNTLTMSGTEIDPDMGTINMTVVLKEYVEETTSSSSIEA